MIESGNTAEEESTVEYRKEEVRGIDDYGNGRVVEHCRVIGQGKSSLYSTEWCSKLVTVSIKFRIERPKS